MGRKYVVTLMDKHKVGEKSLIFNCNCSRIGEIDEKTGFFVDRNGKKYPHIMSSTLMNDNNSKGYTNAIELSNLRSELGYDLSIKESLREYESICKRHLYFVGMTAEEKVFCIHLDMDEIKEQMDRTNDEYEEELDDGLNSELKQLIIDVINGEYSLEELKEIRKALDEECDDIEWTIDTIDLQIEATENGTSLVELPPAPAEYEDYEERVKSKEAKKDRYGFLSQQINKSQSRVDIEELFKKVTETLIAQDEPARRVIVEIARKELDDRKKKEGILLTGPTGVGKTELMRLIAKYLNKPFFKVDSNQLTTAGYTGKDIEEVLWDLYLYCGKNVEAAENAIIFFDEIDKKGSSRKDDHSGQGVLNLLLPFIEGTTYDACEDMRHTNNKVKINTSNMTVILGGAYTDVYKNLVEKNIGFNQSVSSKPIYRPATTQDFIEKGMMTDEFMGRVTVVKLNDLDIADIEKIILESKESAMRIQEEIFKKIGVKITFTPGYTRAIAENAYKKGTGARGLNGIIDETTWKAFDEVYCHMGEYDEVILDEETVNDSSHYQLIKRK